MSLEGGRKRTMLRATAHPLRLQMLSLLTGAELSAAEVARQLGITQANASYHLRFLLDAGLLVIAGEEQVRGGRAKKYRHPWEQTSHADEDTSTEADKQAYVSVLAAAIRSRYAERGGPGPQIFTDADLWVAPEVWSEVVELVARASQLIHQRAEKPGTEGTVRANLSVAAFTLAPDGRGTR